MRSPAYSLNREFLAIFCALLVSPLAFAAVSAIDAWALNRALGWFGMPLDPPDRDVIALFWSDPVSGIAIAYVIGALIVFPPLLLLRARGLLTGWTAVGSALWVPLSGISLITLVFGRVAGANARDILMIFAFLSYLLVPGTTATGAAFWTIYRSVNGSGRNRAEELPECGEPRFT